MMAQLLYNFGIKAYASALRVAATFNPKAKKWVAGRKDWRRVLEQQLPDKIGKRVWFHCASLGEFEQARPVIEALKKRLANVDILLTFFSPSGYEVRKDYALASHVCYLPADTQKNAKDFLVLVQPDLAVFVKYEFWFNYMEALQNSGIPLYSVSAIFRPGQRFFRSGGGFFASGLQSVKWFFVQNEESKNLLNSIGVAQVSVNGDTRFDRVLDEVAHIAEIPLVSHFCAGKITVVAGSTWPTEEQYLAGFVGKSTQLEKLIVAPHEVDAGHIAAIKSKFGDLAICFSELNENNAQQYRVLIVDNIGMLSRLYQYADIAVVGGAFGAGLHNILEAATFGMPILFGPKYDRFQEAKDLIGLGAAVAVSDQKAFETTLAAWLANNETRKLAAQSAESYVKANAGATQVVVNQILEDLL